MRALIEQRIPLSISNREKQLVIHQNIRFTARVPCEQPLGPAHEFSITRSPHVVPTATL